MLSSIFSQITTCSSCQGWGLRCSACQGHGVYLEKNNQRLVFGLPVYFAFKKRLFLSRLKKLIILSVLSVILVLSIL